MDFDISKQMKEDERSFGTQNQRNIIYKEHLIPLKAKISQILLYDADVASTLLQKYLSIEKNEDRAITEILADIGNLTDEIEKYESNKGKEKLFKDQSEVISGQLDDLKENFEALEIKDFETQFLDIRELYNKNLENYSYEDRSFIETKISEVQAKLIIRKVRLGALDLYTEISKDDEASLTMVINSSIYALMQDKNPNVQKIVNEIKYKTIDRTDAVYDPEIWKLLDAAQRGMENTEPRRIEQETSKTTTSNALVPVIPKKRKGFSVPNLGELFGRNVIKIGDQKMKISTTVQIGEMTVNVKDLADIDLEWLAEQVPQQMLIDIEDKKLIKEEKRNVKQKYMPDIKTPIYDEFETINNKRWANGVYIFYNESGTKLVCNRYDKYLKNEAGTCIKSKYDRFEPINENYRIIDYAELIDKLTNGNLRQQLLNELGVCIEKQILRTDIKKDSYTYDSEKFISKLPILRNLSKSYDRVAEQIEKTKMDFMAKEKAKRDEFYQKSQFKDGLKAKESSNSEGQNKIQQSERDRYNSSEAHDGQAEI